MASLLVEAEADPVVLVEDLRFRWSEADAFSLCIPRFELAAGESVFLHGPSGSGKSTLLSLLAGVLLPASGRICIFGQELTQLGAAARDLMGLP